jgi:predicted enzyme related to lactoylglutathione lyase
MSRVIHFEIHADQPERAAKFYTALFGWETTKWGGPVDYWLIKTGPDGQPGINGGLVKRQGPAPGENQPVNAYPCSIDVTALDATLQAITRHGGTIALPKVPIPGIGWLAYGKDTEGNIFGVMQSDPGAK